MEANNAPIFVVGSPRSGTSILTWCLGQHADILAMEESNWMGEFAVQAAAAHAVGSRRGERSQLSSLTLPLPEFLANLGETINTLILNQREVYYANVYMGAYARAKSDPKQSPSGAFELTRDLLVAKRKEIYAKAMETEAADPASLSRALGAVPYGKRRWVDGTPEYSLHLPGLRKLFPSASFIHVVRDVGSVVKSMLKARETLDFELVKNEQDAYTSWLRAVRACLKAEEAWGGQVLRVRYNDLVERPRTALARILRFVSEPFSSDCLKPLAEKINSSSVRPDYDPTDPATDPVLRKKAEKLSEHLMTAKQTRKCPNSASAAALENTFRERVHFALKVPEEYKHAQEVVQKCQRELNERGAWNRNLDQEIAAARGRIVDLQKEVEDRSAWALELQRAADAKDQCIKELQRELNERGAWNRNLDQEK